jgi:hypothetical protein
MFVTRAMPLTTDVLSKQYISHHVIHLSTIFPAPSGQGGVVRRWHLIACHRKRGNQLGKHHHDYGWDG